MLLRKFQIITVLSSLSIIHCQSQNIGYSETKQLIQGNWGKGFVILKDSIFLGKGENYKYELDSNINEPGTKKGGYYIVIIRDSLHFSNPNMKDLWGTPWVIGKVDSISSNYLRIYSGGSDSFGSKIYQRKSP